MLRLLVFVECPRGFQTLGALLPDTFKGQRVQVIDLDRQLSSHEIEKGPCNGHSRLFAGRRKSGMAPFPYLRGIAYILKREIADFDKPALLQIGRRDAPTSLQIAIKPISQDQTQCALRFLQSLEPNGRVNGIQFDWQVKGIENPLDRKPADPAAAAAL